KQGIERVKVRYSKEQRALRRAQRAERLAMRATDPTTIAAVSSDPGRAFSEGHLKADPKKAIGTTSRVIPASIAFVGDAVANLAKSGGRAASTALAEAGASTKKYKGSEITGPLEGVGKEAIGAAKALAPLVS